MKRRLFIKNSAAFSAPLLLNGIPLSALSKVPFGSAATNNNKVLIIIQLQGGNDGLQTVIPLDQYPNLAKVRENIIVPESSILPISDHNGFHPSMSGMRELWDEEKVAIVQSVGYPDQNRSHFRSTDIWQSASSADNYISSGWLGRYFDLLHPDYPIGYPNENNSHPFAITVGASVSETCQGIGANFSMALLDPFNPGTINAGAAGELPPNCFGTELAFTREIIKQTNAYSSEIVDAANAGNNLTDKYDQLDNNAFAEKLAIVARLISGGMQTQVYVVQLGGFDTHGNQVDENNRLSGRHATLLEQLSAGMAAFQDDMKLLGLEERVLSMTYSEFGRRIRSNGSLGTDHGTAAPVFLFGSCVHHGILGENPEIDSFVSNTEGVPMQYDFRNVYATVLSDWLLADSNDIQNVLYDHFTPLPIIRDCSTGNSFENYQKEILNIIAYPNPAQDYVNLIVESISTQCTISIFDAGGAMLQQPKEFPVSSNKISIRVDLSALPNGNYFVRVVSQTGQKTTKIVKQ